jgi:hypothetical protein
MSVFRTFELEAIKLLASRALTPMQLAVLHSIHEPESYDYTGSGYFLRVKHPDLPLDSGALHDPAVVGTSDEIQAGFVVFTGDHELTLECHTWGAVDVPPDFRDRHVLISTPTVTKVDLRGTP